MTVPCLFVDLSKRRERKERKDEGRKRRKERGDLLFDLSTPSPSRSAVASLTEHPTPSPDLRALLPPAPMAPTTSPSSESDPIELHPYTRFETPLGESGQTPRAVILGQHPQSKSLSSVLSSILPLRLPASSSLFGRSSQPHLANLLPSSLCSPPRLVRQNRSTRPRRPLQPRQGYQGRRRRERYSCEFVFSSLPFTASLLTFLSLQDCGVILNAQIPAADLLVRFLPSFSSPLDRTS